MNHSQFQTIYPTFTPASPGLPQAPGEGQTLYSKVFIRISPDTPSFFKLRRKRGTYSIHTPPCTTLKKPGEVGEIEGLFLF